MEVAVAQPGRNGRVDAKDRRFHQSEIRLVNTPRTCLTAMSLLTPLRSVLNPRRHFSLSATRRMKVVPVPVRSDNYAYLLIDEKAKKAAAVDVYDVPKVQAAAQEEGVEIVAAITTHHHHDHSGGNEVCFWQNRLFICIL